MIRRTRAIIEIIFYYRLPSSDSFEAANEESCGDIMDLGLDRLRLETNNEMFEERLYCFLLNARAMRRFSHVDL